MTTATKNGRARFDAAQLTNGAKPAIDLTKPYSARISITGIAPLLFHAWNCEAVEEKAKSAKGSKAKKQDDVESYVYRTPSEMLGIPGKNFHASLVEAGRYMQDPRSPRKSLRDLLKAAIVPLDVIAPLLPETPTWDYEDRQRVTVQRAGITRTRPAMREGWHVTFQMLVTLPEYLPPVLLAQLVNNAGRMVGLLDFRPTYGRFTTSALDTFSAFED
jgi:hypothetical protein